MPTAYLALGSNLGDRQHNLTAAAAMLDATAGIVLRAKSTAHETKSVGGPEDAPDFLNGAVEIETDLPPVELLQACMVIELGLGRQRPAPANMPRTIDVDILLYGDDVIDTPNLTVPHPRMHERRFVLAPLAEIAPHVMHPVLGRSIRELEDELEPANG